MQVVPKAVGAQQANGAAQIFFVHSYQKYLRSIDKKQLRGRHRILVFHTDSRLHGVFCAQLDKLQRGASGTSEVGTLGKGLTTTYRLHLLPPKWCEPYVTLSFIC